MKSSRLLIALAVMAVVSLTACVSGDTGGPSNAPDDSARTADPSATLRIAVSGNPTGFDPQRMTSPRSDPVYLAPLYDQLVKLDNKSQPAPMLAKTFEMSPDNKSITLTLRDDVRFQDGSAFTAAVAKANFERVLANPTSTGARYLTTVSGIETPDDTTLVLRFSQPNPAFPFTLASNFSISAMISAKGLADPDLERNPAGSGGMTLKTAGQDRVSYAKNTSYWDKEAFQYATLELVSMLDDNARFNALQTGAIDVAFAKPQNFPLYDPLTRSGKFIKADAGSQLYGLHLNADAPGLEDPAVRYALSRAIDREAISKALFHGMAEPAFQPLPAGTPGHVDALDDDIYDPEAARKALADAGAGDLSLTAIDAGVEPLSSILAVVQQQLGEVGVKVDIVKVAGSAAQPTWRDGRNSAFLSVINIGIDPSVFLSEALLGADNPAGVPADLRSLANSALQLSVGSPERAAAIEKVSEYVAKSPFQVPIVRLPNQVVAARSVMHLTNLPLTMIFGSQADPRYLAVARDESGS